MTKKATATNDYLSFIASCAKKQDIKYQKALTKGSVCNDKYKKMHHKPDIDELIIEELKPVKKPVKKTVKEPVKKVVKPVKKSTKADKPEKKVVEKKVVPVKKPEPVKKTVKKPVPVKKTVKKPVPVKKSTKADKPEKKVVPVKKPEPVKKTVKKPVPVKKSTKADKPVKKVDKPEKKTSYYQDDEEYIEDEEYIPKTQYIEDEDVEIEDEEYYPEQDEDELIELSEQEIMKSITKEQEVYKDNPDVQYSPRAFGNGYGYGYGYNMVSKLYPDIQDVDLLTKPKHNKFYGMRYKPLKFENPYKGSGVVGTAVIIEGLEKTGLFQASKDVLQSLTRKFDEWLSNPSATRQHRIISRLIPDMTYKYNKLKNELEVFGEKWKPFRIDNHKIKMLNIEDKISSLLMELEVL
jgi:hypothetical protein